MMTGYAPDKSTANVAADQYHHYKVSSVFIYTHYCQRKTLCDLPWFALSFLEKRHGIMLSIFCLDFLLHAN
jgi:hypothetical protein